MDINKICESMKVLKDECNKYKKCEDCIFNNPKDGSCVLLEKDPCRWEEDKIIENNCTTAHYDYTDEWLTDVIRCDDCDEVFMLSGGLIDEKYVVGKFCPYCGKKIINYKKEDKEE